MTEHPSSQSNPFGGKTIERRTITDRPFSSSNTVFRYNVGGELCSIEYSFVSEPGIDMVNKFKE